MNGNKRSLALGIVMSLLFLSMFGSVGFVSAGTETANLNATNHIAYHFDATSTSSWDTAGTGIGAGDYSAMSGSDDSRFGISSANGKYKYLRWEFNISKISTDNGFSLTDISNINILTEGYGHTYNGGDFYAITSVIYDDTDSLWRSANSSEINGIFAHTTGGDGNLILDVNGSIGDYIASDGILAYSMRTNIGDGVHTADLYIDYVLLTITYEITLTTPALVSPTSGGTGYGTVIGFDWNASTGGTSPYTYEIMVADNLLFTAPDVNVTSISDTNYSYTTGLTPATTYYWKVRAKDNGGAYSSWATTQSFTTASIASPSFSSPTNGGGSTTVTPTFSWSASTGGSGTYTYELQVSLLNTFATATVDQTAIASTSYTMTSNLTPDVFYARIRSKDSLNNYSAWSSTITFTASTPADEGGGASTVYNPVVIPTVQEPTVDDTSDDNLVSPAGGGSVTNIINKYIINPVRTIVLNPLKLLWEWFVGLFRGSSQETLIEPVADEAESEFNRIVKDMSEDWDAFWSDVNIFIGDVKEVLGC